MSVRRIITSLMALGLAVLLGGCGRDTGLSYGPEIDDPSYREGEQFKKQGRIQEALSAYLKVIEKRGDQSSPESHLEVGIILKQHIKDPLEAIHHFRKYLELQPNSRQAPLVRSQMEDAKREFARTLPAQPMESQAARLEGFDQIDRLRQENDQLKAEIATLRGNSNLARPTNTVRVSVGEAAEPKESLAAPIPVDDSSPITLAPMGPRDTDAPVVQATPAPSASVATTQPATPTRPAVSKPTAPGGPRRHSVAAKETLWTIARKYYGASVTGAQVEAIRQANRAVLTSGDTLKPGMELRIP